MQSVWNAMISVTTFHALDRFRTAARAVAVVDCTYSYRIDPRPYDCCLSCLAVNCSVRSCWLRIDLHTPSAVAVGFELVGAAVPVAMLISLKPIHVFGNHTC